MYLKDYRLYETRELSIAEEPRCLDGFTEYIQKKHRLNTDHNWVSTIEFFSSDDEHAFYDFYKELEEYMEQDKDI